MSYSTLNSTLIDIENVAGKVGLHLEAYLTKGASKNHVGSDVVRLENFVRSAYVPVLNALLDGKKEGKFIAEKIDEVSFCNARFSIIEKGSKTILILDQEKPS